MDCREVEQLKTLLKRYEGVDIASNGDVGKSGHGKKEEENSYPLCPTLEDQSDSAAGVVAQTYTPDTHTYTYDSLVERILKSSEQKQRLSSNDDGTLRDGACNRGVGTESRVLEENQLLQREIKALRARHTYDQKEDRRVQQLERQESSKVISRPLCHPQM